VRFTPIQPPRVFTVGPKRDIHLKDCARIGLEADEQVTFETASGAEYDVVRKSWGYYATPSLNRRLLQFGLHAALVKSPDGTFYVFLIEGDRIEDFHGYCAEQSLKLVRWLDGSEKLVELEAALEGSGKQDGTGPGCTMCGERSSRGVFTYEAPPPGETRFPRPAGQPYKREVVRCQGCGHFTSLHEMDLNALYAGEYMDSTYGDRGLRRAFERIVALGPEESDNRGRVRRIVEYARGHFPSTEEKAAPLSVLDVGSGLCVFLHGMKAAGWRCTALDPDSRAVQHAREAVGVEAVEGDLMTARGLGRYDLVTFNKVLEHVKDPVALLAKAREHLSARGLLYLEVPDGEAAVQDGPGREEFFIEHWHVFSAASLALLAGRAGLSLRALERLREPSGKYTLRAFLVAGAGG